MCFVVHRVLPRVPTPCSTLATLSSIVCARSSLRRHSSNASISGHWRSYPVLWSEWKLPLPVEVAGSCTASGAYSEQGRFLEARASPAFEPGRSAVGHPSVAPPVPPRSKTSSWVLGTASPKIVGVNDTRNFDVGMSRRLRRLKTRSRVSPPLLWSSHHNSRSRASALSKYYYYLVIYLHVPQLSRLDSRVSKFRSQPRAFLLQNFHFRRFHFRRCYPDGKRQRLLPATELPEAQGDYTTPTKPLPKVDPLDGLSAQLVGTDQSVNQCAF